MFLILFWNIYLSKKSKTTRKNQKLNPITFTLCLKLLVTYRIKIQLFNVSLGTYLFCSRGNFIRDYPWKWFGWNWPRHFGRINCAICLIYCNDLNSTPHMLLVLHTKLLVCSPYVVAFAKCNALHHFPEIFFTLYHKILRYIFCISIE